jgi:hypothetical protein
MSNVINLHSGKPGAEPEPETNPWWTCAIHHDVPIAKLVSALAHAGLTMTNVKGKGLVIHQAGQDPTRWVSEGPR